MKNEFTILLCRLEVDWLYRQLTNARDKTEARLKTQGRAEDPALQTEYDTLTKLVISCKDLINTGDNNRLRLMSLRNELEEAITICEEPDAVIEARKQLDNLPKEEDYRVMFDRETAKFTLKLLEKDIEWIRGVNIPNLQKRDSKSFEDKIMTRSYYINKAKRAKSILEGMKKKIETELV